MFAIPKDDAIRLRHMADAADKALQLVQDQDRASLDDNEMLSLAVIRLLEVIGEAATRVSAGTQSEFPQIPWREIVSSRHRLIHGYFNVDLDVVWSILQQDLPSLVVNLKQILSAQ